MALFRSYLYKFINFNIIFTYLVTLYFFVHVVAAVKAHPLVSKKKLLIFRQVLGMKETI